MSQPPSQPGSWDPNAGQPDYSQGSQNPYAGTESFGSPSYGSAYDQQPSYEQSSYTPPPQYGGYPPAAYGSPYGQQGYPPQYGTPYGPGAGGPQRPGAALAAAVLSYIQAGVVLLCTFFVLAAGTASTEALLIGILQLISVGVLIFGSVQITSGTGRLVLIVGSALQLALVLYYLIRFSTIGDAIDFDDEGGFFVVIPLFFAVMPAVALALTLTTPVSRFIAEKKQQSAAQRGQAKPWGQ